MASLLWRVDQSTGNARLSGVILEITTYDCGYFCV
ncbi:predicted protein [Sclerotinia sclerotiorum 1980 UF-70]|uniref:Uncharacterized protein n=1 Tax=Sclerotinia sclerotiorum (strain ATCC 18683 / 1980 / Ss-1) TaxID=665079 RepID=A7F6Q7_SCLS1|nr:predicted protein [Sclerotinia sclerotiorum 1980 UF-70]EDN98428.1 predicted protein [Sclerotinia sclerotiorum 1980 UF-70]